jgi:prolyl oligopeptidase
MANTMIDEEDPYIWLEEVESPESIEFAKSANAKCLAELGDPSETDTYKRVLTALQSDDRIPYVRMLGYDEDTGDMLLYNFWRDANSPKGIWRKTTMQQYQSDDTEWTTVLDLDKLAKEEDISWVWKGYTALPRSLDSQSGGPMGRVSRVLLHLSRGGADATYLREFDLLTESFVDVEGGGFSLPEAKTRASYKSRDVLLVGADTGEDSMTSSGYPRTVREWKRGTKIEDAPIVFEGEKTDVSCGQYLIDESDREGGDVYEVQSRSISFYDRYTYVKKQSSSDDFVKMAVALNTGVSFYGRWMMITLKADWHANDNGSDKSFKSGSLLYVDAESFIKFSKAKESGDEDEIKNCKLEYRVLFEPTATTSYSGYSTTKSYLIVYILDDVKEQLKFYKLGEGGGPFVQVGGDEQGQIRSVSASPVDSRTSDLIFETTSSYISPSKLVLADANKVGTDDYVVSELKSLPEMFDSSNLEVTQHFAVSKDGTRIPYFMICKKGMKLDGTTPTLLYGYGGFEVSLGPRYVTSVGISWLERGGVYVEANIRGGGEYGPVSVICLIQINSMIPHSYIHHLFSIQNWHQQALRENRHLCYEDFIAVGQDLVDSKVCSPQTLACRGGSNGGLLTGNMLVQAPDLFQAIHIAVPLLDMKRYSKLLAGASWMAEYGDPDTDDWENFLHKYSPYHNIDVSRDKYPNVLVTTSTRDDRVHPAHARKMVKKLWDLGEEKDKNWPVYYYENIEGGHGGASDSRQEAFMTSLSYDFMWRALTNSLPKKE